MKPIEIFTRYVQGGFQSFLLHTPIYTDVTSFLDQCVQIIMPQKDSKNILWVEENVSAEMLRKFLFSVNRKANKKWPRIAIIQVDTLSYTAYNVLLKALEEPDSNIYYMVLSSLPRTLPKTLQSRLTKIALPQPILTDTGSLQEMIYTLYPDIENTFSEEIINKTVEHITQFVQYYQISFLNLVHFYTVNFHLFPLFCTGIKIILWVKIHDIPIQNLSFNKLYGKEFTHIDYARMYFRVEQQLQRIVPPYSDSVQSILMNVFINT